MLLFILCVALVSATQSEYPLKVLLDRRNFDIFVQNPHVIKNVTSIELKRVSPSPKRKEVHVEYGSHVDLLKFGCRDDPSVYRLDIPGRLDCEKTVYLIPSIIVERGRFFNISLDFLKIFTQPGVETERTFTDPQLQLSIIRNVLFVSGVFTDQSAGSMYVSLEAHRGLNEGQKIKIRIKVGEPNLEGLLNVVGVQLKIKRPSDVNILKRRISIINCVSRLFFIDPIDLKDAVITQTTASEFQFKGKSKSETSCKQLLYDVNLCPDFEVSSLTINGNECPSLDNASTEDFVVKDNTPSEGSGSIEETVPLEPSTKSPISPADNLIPYHETRLSTSRTIPEEETNTEHQIDKYSNSIDQVHRSVVRAPKTDEINDGKNTETKANAMRDENFLKTTEFYGITAVASIPLIVAFILVFVKMAKCKRQRTYTPVTVKTIEQTTFFNHN